MEQYEEVRTLGRGAFGVAILVKLRDGANRGAYRVVKQVDLSALKPESREASYKEVAVLRQLSHPNIVAYFDAFIGSARLCIVMEFADSGDLCKKIKDKKDTEEGAYDEAEAMRMFGQCLLALQYIHGKRIIHRDIKSQNIFLMSTGDVKVGDCGIAKVMDGTTAVAGTVIGTPSYLPPEICNDEPYGSKVDIWSMGVVLYELNALKLPFSATNVVAVVLKIIAAEPPALPPTVSAETSEIILSMLRKKPDERPGADELLQLPAVSRHLASDVELHGGGSMEQFEVIEELGRGAFGVALLVVPRGRSAQAPRRVVKSVDLASLSASARNVAHKEVALLRRLAHPHIIAYFDAFLENDKLHIVLEYADDGDLFRAVESRKAAIDPFSESDAMRIFGQGLDALQYIHAKRILHRDIKTQNLFRMKTGDVKLGDFGISKVIEDTATKATALQGTTAYMAPEICKGEDYNGKVDVWALGVVLYELLTLELPFRSAHGGMAATIKKIVDSDFPPLPSSCSVEIRDIVSRVLQKDQAERPTAEELLAMSLVARFGGLEADMEASKKNFGASQLQKSISASQCSTGTLFPTLPGGGIIAGAYTGDSVDSIDGLPKRTSSTMEAGGTIAPTSPAGGHTDVLKGSLYDFFDGGPKRAATNIEEESMGTETPTQKLKAVLSGKQAAPAMLPQGLTEDMAQAAKIPEEVAGAEKLHAASDGKFVQDKSFDASVFPAVSDNEQPPSVSEPVTDGQALEADGSGGATVPVDPAEQPLLAAAARPSQDDAEERKREEARKKNEAMEDDMRLYREQHAAELAAIAAAPASIASSAAATRRPAAERRLSSRPAEQRQASATRRRPSQGTGAAGAAGSSVAAVRLLRPSSAGAEFLIILDKTSGQEGLKLGIDIIPEGSTAWVEGMHAQGHVPRWNLDNPALAVRVYDHIVQVNGVRGDAQRLVDELKSSDVLEIILSRPLAVKNGGKAQGREISSASPRSSAGASRASSPTPRSKALTSPPPAGTGMNDPVRIRTKCLWD